jgi:hypothetical protein
MPANPSNPTEFSDKNAAASKRGVTDGYAKPAQSGSQVYDSAPVSPVKNGQVNLDHILGRSRFDK